jgi:hypothetical protein
MEPSRLVSFQKTSRGEGLAMIINPINDTSDPSFLADEQAAINILDAAFTANGHLEK